LLCHKILSTVHTAVQYAERLLKNIAEWCWCRLWMDWMLWTAQ